MAWPCFGLAIATGIWSLCAINLGGRDTGYLTALLVKLLQVGLSGTAAAIHSTTRGSAVRGATGVLGALAALGALLIGAVLVTRSPLRGPKSGTPVDEAVESDRSAGEIPTGTGEYPSSC